LRLYFDLNLNRAFVIGIDTYNSESLRNLDACNSDAIQVFDALKKIQFQIFKDKFYTGDITHNYLREEIVDFFTRPYGATEIVIFYFSGHGILSTNGEPYLCVSDTDPDKPIDKGLSITDLLSIAKECKSANILIILDCCYSGETVLQTKMKQKIEYLSNPRICIIASSLPLEQSFILPEYQNSIFTHFLLQGLKGFYEALNTKGILTLSSLFLYIYRKLFNMKISQEPVYYCIDRDIKITEFPEFQRKHLSFSLLSDLEKFNELIISNEFKDSSKYFNQLLNSSQLAKTYYLQGISLFNESRFNDAIKSFVQAFNIDKNLAQALVASGICYGQMYQFESARKQFHLALDYNPEDKGILYNIGLSYILEYKYDEGMEIFKKILNKDKLDSDGLIGLGACFAGLGNYVCAMVSCQKILEFEPNDVMTKNNLAQAYSNMGEHEIALGIISKILENHSDDFRYLLSMGLILCRKGEYRQAISYFEKTIQLKTNSYEAHFYKGMTYGYLNENRNAMNSFKEAIRINPNDFHVWYNLGVSNDKLGRMVAALICYEVSLKFNDKYDGVFHAKGMIFLQQRKIIDAIQNFSIAIGLNNYDTDSLVNLATCFTLLIPRNNISIHYLKEVIKLNPQDVEILYFLAELYYQRGNYYQDKEEILDCLQCLQKILSIDKGHSRALILAYLCCEIMERFGQLPNICKEL
jgi:tetratricopeptide (TPR) repeat protein